MWFRTAFDQQQYPAWLSLRVFSVYRALISILLLAGFYWRMAELSLGVLEPTIFLYTAWTYLVFNVLCLMLSYFERVRFSIQVVGGVFLDIVFLTLLMDASDGISSGLAVLINISVASGSLLYPGRIAFLFAAWATLAVFVEQSLLAIRTHFFRIEYFHGGIWGATFFATAILGFGLAYRLQKTEALVSRRGEDLLKLAKLNECVIAKLRSGILIVDGDNIIQLLNQAALQLLNISRNPMGQLLSSISEKLSEQLQSWRIENTQPLPFREKGHRYDLIAQFISLYPGIDQTVLVFLDDSARTIQQAQQLKLASLGRLTAGIAHEIRNPLSAISHAAELLDESASLGKEEERFIEIIRNNVARTNEVIKNALQLSRQSQTVPKRFFLKPWLEQVLSELASIRADKVMYQIDVPESLAVCVDESQLRQVVTNLSENGWRFSKQQTGISQIDWRGYIEVEKQIPVLEIKDNGPGILEEHVPQIFDPFFTTTQNSTGLGLYVARELCQANSLHLDFYNHPEGGACFRITFSNMTPPME